MNKNKYYIGIGSRNIPKTIQFLMKNVSEYLCKNNYILRSGGVDGAMERFVDYVIDDSNAMIEDDDIYCFELNEIATL